MPQFPLALAIEPRLLPHAVANGFSMDYKVLTDLFFFSYITTQLDCQYRDFVFRKMFERPTSMSNTRPEEMAENVRELCKLDPVYVSWLLVASFFFF